MRSLKVNVWQDPQAHGWATVSTQVEPQVWDEACDLIWRSIWDIIEGQIQFQIDDQIHFIALGQMPSEDLDV
jgi:hypothetical protein